MNELGVSRLRLGVLGSGRGTNFVAIQEAIQQGRLNAEVVLVVSDVPDSRILEEARERKVPGRYLAPGPFRSKLDETAESTCLKWFEEVGVNLVVLAGFMRILKGAFLQAYSGRVINIHPSLLPSFPGLTAWKQALDHGVKVTGCTVHLVDAGIDTGPILAQEAVAVFDEDTAETLHERIQVAERSLYPRVIQSVGEGRIRIQGRRSIGF